MLIQNLIKIIKIPYDLSVESKSKPNGQLMLNELSRMFGFHPLFSQNLVTLWILSFVPNEFYSWAMYLALSILEFETYWKDRYIFQYISKIPTTIQELLEITIATINIVKSFESKKDNSSKHNANIIHNLKMIIQKVIIYCNIEIQENREFLFDSLANMNPNVVRCISKTVVRTMDKLIGHIPILLHEFVSKVISCWIINNKINTDAFNFIVNDKPVNLVVNNNPLSFSSTYYNFYSLNTHFLLYVFNIIFSNGIIYHEHIDNESFEFIWFYNLLCRFYPNTLNICSNYEDIRDAATIVYNHTENFEYWKDKQSNICKKLNIIKNRILIDYEWKYEQFSNVWNNLIIELNSMQRRIEFECSIKIDQSTIYSKIDLVRAVIQTLHVITIYYPQCEIDKKFLFGMTFFHEIGILEFGNNYSDLEFQITFIKLLTSGEISQNVIKNIGLDFLNRYFFMFME